MKKYQYELCIIGGGSAGVRSANIATSQYKINTLLVEKQKLGGTCVNLGCVPKKLMFYNANFAKSFSTMHSYGWKIGNKSLNWSKFVDLRNKEITRLNQIYSHNLSKNGVNILYGDASFIDKNTISVGNKTITADKFIIATGAVPLRLPVSGKEFSISSDGIFDIRQLPKSMTIIGGGFIGCEFASIFNALGTKIDMIFLEDRLLEMFDSSIAKFFSNAMEKSGITLHPESRLSSISKKSTGEFNVHFNNDRTSSADIVLMAPGRIPNIQGLKLDKLAMQTKEGAIVVDKYYRTNISNIYAIGDVKKGINLTPVAIKEGEIIINNLYGNKKARTLDYSIVPTTVFAMPNVGTVGLSEDNAINIYDDIDVYETTFTQLKNTLSENPLKTLLKLIVNTNNDRVLGYHLVAEGAGEIIQGFAATLSANITKTQLNSTFPIHPTIAEDFVTMKYPTRKYRNKKLISE